MDNTTENEYDLVIDKRSEIIKQILNLNISERQNIYKELIWYCGSKDRKFIRDEIKQYKHKGIFKRLQ